MPFGESLHFPAGTGRGHSKVAVCGKLAPSSGRASAYLGTGGPTPQCHAVAREADFCHEVHARPEGIVYPPFVYLLEVPISA